MRTTTVNTLCELIEEGHNLHLLTADLGFGLLDDFRKRYPLRFTNVGVAEPNMVSLAAGMATTGIRVFCYSMVPFILMRAFEQVRMDLCVSSLPVVLIGVGGGISYGCEGPSHYALEDVAIAKSLPNLTVLAPGDPLEARLAVRAAANANGPTFLRLGRNNDPIVHTQQPSQIALPLIVVADSPALVIFATGHILAETLQAVELLAAKGTSATLVSVPTLKPLAREAIRRLAAQARIVATVEEHSAVGGLGADVAEILLEGRFGGRFVKISLPDAFPTDVGGHAFLRGRLGLSAAAIAEFLEREVQGNP